MKMARFIGYARMLVGPTKSSQGDSALSLCQITIGTGQPQARVFSFKKYSHRNVVSQAAAAPVMSMATYTVLSLN